MSTEHPTGVELITAERLRQVEEEGWMNDHDREHRGNAMAKAAACYALPSENRTLRGYGEHRYVPALWPWDAYYWKPCPDNRVRELVKAGALIAAEIDRLLTQES